MQSITTEMNHTANPRVPRVACKLDSRVVNTASRSCKVPVRQLHPPTTTRQLLARAAQPSRPLAKDSLGFGFSAGGLLFPYYIGVADALTSAGIVTPKTQIAGSSAGSIVAACNASGIGWDIVTEACLKLAHDCRTKGTRFRLSSVLRCTLETVLPDDIHRKCSGTCFIAVTRVIPTFRPELVSNYTSKQDVIQTLLTSCHIPWYFDGQLVTQYRESLCFDGGITNFIPSTPSETCVKVCCFPREQMRAFSDISIAPDAFSPWPYNLQQMLAWAFEPAAEDMLLQLIDQGRQDALSWATASKLVSSQHALLLTSQRH